jgi:hypothetical protein
VGLRVEQLQQASPTGQFEIEVSWSYLDDDQMLINLLLSF